jgi:hypothetical protein
VWTNHNYKWPLISSGMACLLGNLAYCLSYDWNAVWLLFIARLITGFGARLPCAPACSLLPMENPAACCTAIAAAGAPACLKSLPEGHPPQLIPGLATVGKHPNPSKLK